MDRLKSPDRTGSSHFARQWPPHRIWLPVLVIPLVGLGLLLAACTRVSPPPTDPWAEFRPGLREPILPTPIPWETFPQYRLNVELADDLRLLTGTGTIRIPNRSPDPWTQLVFRLYPNLEHYGGRLRIQSVAVAGVPTPYTYQAENTAMVVDLPQVLMPNQEIALQIAWSLAIPEWSGDASAAYRLFGISQGMTSLPLFYPSLAVYTPGAGWWLEMGSVRGDAAFNLASLFVVTATLPSHQVPVFSGEEITRTQVDGYHTRYVWTSGPIREFTLHLGADLRSQSVEAYNTRVTSYWLPGQEGAGQAALQHAAGALRAYSDRFGPYPYPDLRVSVAPLSFRGMEYSQVLLLGIRLYGSELRREELELRTAHEVAHQWWYLLVHNDPVNHPWLDEGLAEYTSRIYLEAVYGPARANELYQRWALAVNRLAANGEDAPLNLPVDAYANGSQYETVVYGKGALFFHALREALGDEPFFALLQQYLDTHRYDIVTPADLLALLREYDPASADLLWQQWIGIPSP